MKISQSSLNDLPPHIKALNPHLYNLVELDSPKRKQAPVQALDRSVQKQGSRKVRVGVQFVRFGRKELDSDNLVIAYKPLRDAVAATLGVDDNDKRIKWDYAQVLTTGQTGTLVKFDLL